ncbi:S8 family serine peptidase [Actinomadura syzygii]|uniref:S8 family serine peptidase n=1 Tax=Actinomadura syzygii TaxID=1427538 RepID=UPI001CA3421F|nr:S8 family serine peptidase [Actinomadura syzygii]
MLGAVVALLLLSPTPALAVPEPRKELYWFDWWELQKKVWPITTGKGITVAVVDREVDIDLPDLKGAVLPNVNMNDVRMKPDPENGGHGAAMSALIVGQGRGTGMVGVAPDAKVLPLSAQSAGAWAKALRYATDHGAKVVNISQGDVTFQPCDPLLQAAVSYAVQRDVVVVVSAGNEGRHGDWRSSPANCAGVLAVGGLDGQVEPWSGSTPGEYVMGAAPAVEVGSIDGFGHFVGRGHAGTSPAAALTSGVVALVRARFPNMPAREVVRRILATAKDVGKPGWDDVTGYGLVRPYRALVDNVPATAPNPVYDRWQATQAGSRPSVRPSTASPAAKSAKKTSGNTWWVWPSLFGAVVAIVAGSLFIYRKRLRLSR